MSKYHINQSTGDYGKCTAEKRPCPLGDAVIHMNNLSDVIEYSDLVMKENYGEIPALKKSKKIKNPEDIKLKINSKYPYPVAHKLDKIDQVTFSLKEGYVSSEVISSLEEKMTTRGAYYYAEAACYLGLAEAVVDNQGNKSFSLTQDGSDYIKQDKTDRENILQNAINNIDLVEKIKNEEENDNLLKHISQSHGENLETSSRKLASMKAWMKASQEKGFLNEIDEEDVEGRIAQSWEIYNSKNTDTPIKTKENYGEVCGTCFMTKSVTGVCNNCDE